MTGVAGALPVQPSIKRYPRPEQWLSIAIPLDDKETYLLMEVLLGSDHSPVKHCTTS